MLRERQEVEGSKGANESELGKVRDARVAEPRESHRAEKEGVPGGRCKEK